MQHTTELEFNQAMQDFKTMFPKMDGDVIEVVLRSNQGAVDATIDQLLSMSTDNELERAKATKPESTTRTPSDKGDATSQEPLSLSVIKGWRPALLQPLPPGFLRLQNDRQILSGGGNLGRGCTEGSLLAMWFLSLFNKLRVRRRWKKREKRRLKAEALHFTNLTESDIEDERIAMLLQNEEFMSELRWNKDFLSALDDESPPERRGSAFPTRPPDDDALFKERLRNMGKMSRKKFSQIARVFTGKKKKSGRSGGPAPSRDDFLLREEQDADY